MHIPGSPKRPALTRHAVHTFLAVVILALAVGAGGGAIATDSSGAAAGKSVITIPLTAGKNGPSDLQFSSFSFNGRELPAGSITVRDLAPGVRELTNSQNAVGEFVFHVQDDSDYFGFGERFDALNQAHRIIE